MFMIREITNPCYFRAPAISFQGYSYLDYFCHHHHLLGSTMGKYYLRGNKEPLGPYDKNELKNLLIPPSAFIWFEGMDDWKTAGEIIELTDIINKEAGSPDGIFWGDEGCHRLEFKADQCHDGYRQYSARLC